MKLRKKRVFVLVAIILVVAVGFMLLKPEKTLELKGQKEITIAMNQTYQDEGTNIDDVDVSGEVNTKKAGTYTLTYTYHKQRVKRTVKVVDTSNVVINLNGSQETYVLQNDPYIESGCHVIDKKKGNITSQVKTSGEVDTSKVGDYKVTYSVSIDGYTYQKERVVHVVEKTNFQANQNGIPVLMYHYVYTKQDVPKTVNANYILDTDLEAQLKYLTQEKYYFPSYQELKAYVEGKISLPKKSVILTFDDGQKGFLKYGIPLLEKYQVPATSFVIGSKDGENKVKNYASEYITYQSHSYNMHHGGGNIGHGGVISAMTEQQILDDLTKNQTIVQNSEAFAYPYGDVTEDGKKAVTASQTLCAFTTQYGKVKQGMSLNELPRVRVLGNASLKSYIASIE